MILATWCSGIGAPEQAVAGLAGWSHHSFAEIEPFPSAVLAARFPGVPNLGDLTAPDFLDRFLALGIPDLIVAGTPCQAFSIAGLRGGLSDARGNLTLRAMALYNGVCDAARLAGKPEPVFVWENVPGALSHEDNPFGCLLAGLVGHDSPIPSPGGGSWSNAGMVAGPARRAAWRVLDAQFFGLAQRRARVFLVASAGDGPDPAAVLFERQGLRRHPPSRGEAQQDVAGTLAGSLGQRGGVPGNPEAGGQLIPAGDGVSVRGLPGDERGDLVADLRMVQPRADIAGTLNANGKAAGSATQQDAEQGMLIAMTLEDSGGRSRGDGTPPGMLVADVSPTISARSAGGGGLGTDYDLGGGLIGEGGATALRHRDLSRGVDSDCTDTLIAHSLRGEGFDASEDGTGRASATSGVPRPVPSSPIPFDTTQITSPENRSNPQPGDPAGSLSSGAHPPAIAFQDRFRGDDGDPMFTLGAERPHGVAVGPQEPTAFSCKDHGADASDGLAPTLRAVPHDGSHANGGGQMAVAFHGSQDPDVSGDITHPVGRNHGQETCAMIGWQVRRPTPTECERLQGCADGFTAIPWRKKELEDCPDGPRYKALGNSMAVPVLRWILTRLAATRAS